MKEKKEASDLWYETDSQKWWVQIDSKTMKQKSCQPKGLDTIMFRARSHIVTNISVIPKVLADMSIRKQWET